ncbi:hypothetical protein [Candidatus Liberibacter sp.]|uniref:hypothetical protein n=1 Tax=Candidatus Liberibacter sp. TaxID=34022 RepID=UPI0015F64DC3|nr:hypothetical protein [Candidatus Liberibacter sp.]MBA5723885.1 hypothetical protein [Candidatus Liberibacter sp.]
MTIQNDLYEDPLTLAIAIPSSKEPFSAHNLFHIAKRRISLTLDVSSLSQFYFAQINFIGKP